MEESIRKTQTQDPPASYSTLYNKHIYFDQAFVDQDQKNLSLFKEFFNDESRKGIVSVNPITRKQEYSCPKCFKVYSYLSTLYRHLKFECGKQPQFQCAHCQYRAHRKDNIKAPIIGKHEQSKKTSCPCCPKTFVHRFRLVEHMNLYHKDSLPTAALDSLSQDAGETSRYFNVAATDPNSSVTPLQTAETNQELKTPFPNQGTLQNSSAFSVLNVPKISSLPFSSLSNSGFKLEPEINEDSLEINDIINEPFTTTEM